MFCGDLLLFVAEQEDEQVCQLVKQYGMKSWSFIARLLTGRLGKQCRERWYNHLNPDINKEPWTAEEDAMIVEVSGFTSGWPHALWMVVDDDGC